MDFSRNKALRTFSGRNTMNMDLTWLMSSGRVKFKLMLTASKCHVFRHRKISGFLVDDADHLPFISRSHGFVTRLYPSDESFVLFWKSTTADHWIVRNRNMGSRFVPGYLQAAERVARNFSWSSIEICPAV
jgi:hypothetical protein